MERIGVLINKLQELHQEKASPDQLMHVLQMLQTEVFLLKQQAGAGNRRKIAVVMPSNIATKTIDEEIAMPEDFVKVKVEEVKIQEQPDNSLFVENKKEVQPVTQNSFNVFEEVTTLSHQPKVKELNEVIGKESTS
ncbi:MAG: hypothetical protein J0I84_13180, partial [Terrimonas sp.]|nr:hypothetical protein [Terrimonas sp.]